MSDHRNGHPRRTSNLSRRGLVLGGASGLGAAALAPRWVRGQTPVELTFSFAPDESGSMAQMIEAFNAANEGRIRVSWREMPVETDAYREQLESEFLVGSPEIDVIGADLIWTAQFAYEGWVRDLSTRFYADYSANDFLPASIGSTAFRNRIWAVPWFAAVGMLYYRRDLLEASGFQQPPTTWDELKAQALKVKQDAGIPYGFVFQGGDYEGGVTNALEYLWSAGGRVMTQSVGTPGEFGLSAIAPNVVTVSSQDSITGFNIARSLVAEGVAPEQVAMFNEQDALDVFLAGEAVFMRNWPFVYGLLDNEDVGLSAEQVGIAPIPTTETWRRHYGCQGGWNLMINRYSPHPDAAWAFIRFATSPEMQRMRAIEGGFMPTISALYEDTDLVENVPVIGQAADVFREGRNRPVTPFYPEISRRIAITFNRVLRGELDGAEAVARLQRELRTIIRELS
jgi:multiple sugar transport system substrate-binding protein